jgi:Flp pilus assembly protein TadD
VKRVAPSSAAASLLLLLLVAAVYGRVLSFPFVNFDDTRWIAGNGALAGGFTAASVRYAFTEGGDAGLIPLTWLSRILDVSLFGTDARGHHAVNVLLHAGNVLLLFHLLRKGTGEAGKSLLVAALFAVHPLHVESVAWVTERKDVLYAFFWLLAVAAYGRYAARPSARRYGALLLLFALSLASKPSAVTFPFALLLLDLWPLGRLGAPSLRGWAAEGSDPGRGGTAAPRSGPVEGAAGKGSASPAEGEAPPPPLPPVPTRFLLLEKVPLLLLSALVSVVTLRFQAEAGAVDTLGNLPLLLRAGNAVLSYGTYLRRFLLPYGLAPFYPHPGEALPWGWAALSALLVAAVTAAAASQLRRRRWIPAGWLWFLGTLVPVLGLVQAGGKGTADRCVYLPLVGIYVVVAWGGGEIAGRLRLPRMGRVAAAAAWIALLSVVAFRQAGYWSDSVTLNRRALAVTEGNWLALNNLALALDGEGKGGEAERLYREALRVRPDYPEAEYNLALLLTREGRDAEAEERLRACLLLDPASAEAQNNLAVLLARRGAKEEALARFREAVRLRPAYAAARTNLGLALLSRGDEAGAMRELREAVALDPGSTAARNGLGVLLATLGRREEAADQFRSALAADPGNEGARRNLERLRREGGGRAPEAAPRPRSAGTETGAVGAGSDK